jgi:hypothetical protein
VSASGVWRDYLGKPPAYLAKWREDLVRAPHHLPKSRRHLGKCLGDLRKPSCHLRSVRLKKSYVPSSLLVRLDVPRPIPFWFLLHAHRANQK